MFPGLSYKQSIYEKYIKRILDVICSLIAIIVLLPFILIIAIMVRIKLGSPIFFAQKRPGYNEKVFTLYKFRTMTNKKDPDGNFLSDEERLTSFGKKLRSTSLDELPELFNVLRGDMSLVGPRPLLVSYLPYYTKQERKRHSVRPGLSGLAQINGRNFLDWNKRLAMDVKYVENVSLGLDIYIIIITILQVFRHKDVAVDTDKVEGNLANIRRKHDEHNKDVHGRGV